MRAAHIVVVLNRFYILGNVVGDYTTPTVNWFNWASHDGSVWYQVMDNATSYNMMARLGGSSLGNFPAQCFVDQQDRVYSVAGDTWMSNNLGVTFTKVQTSTSFPTRVNFAGAIYSTSPASDTIFIMGGEGASDAWQTTNGGQSWTVVSSSLPWGVRGNINLAVSQNLVFVAQGGDCRASTGCGPRGYGTAPVVYNDIWISVTYGSTWYSVNPYPSSAPLLSLAGIIFDSKGFMYLIGGQGNNYGAWTSAQYGVQPVAPSRSLAGLQRSPTAPPSPHLPPSTVSPAEHTLWEGPGSAPHRLPSSPRPTTRAVKSPTSRSYTPPPRPHLTSLQPPGRSTAPPMWASQ